MPDSKITALTSILTSTDPANDPLVIVDVSDTSMAATGTNKKVTLNQLLGASGTATLASATITGALAANADTTLGTASKSTNTNLNLSSDLGTQRIYLDRGTRSLVFQDVTSSIENYRIAGITGVHTWGVGGSTAMTLNSTGLGVGGSPVSSYRLLSAKTSGGAQLALTTGGLNGSNASPLNIDLDFLGFSNETRARIRSTDQTSDTGNGFLSFWTQNGGTFTEKMRLSTEGNVGIGVAPSGSGGCLQLKSGITFPATQVASSDANTLDDYEEGTFTPIIQGSSSAGTGTYTTQSGRYTKIGRRVFVDIFLVWGAHTGTGNMEIGGLPYSVVSGSGYYPSITIGECYNIALTANNLMVGYSYNGATKIVLEQYPVGGGVQSSVPIDTSGVIACSISYDV